MDKTLLITGGTGSLGQSLLDEVLKTDTYDKVRVFARSEKPFVDMMRRVQDKRIRVVVGDVRDRDAVDYATRGVTDVIHCAAMKHVDFCEMHTMDAIKTNVIGTINVIHFAILNKCEKVLAISSDKGVLPISTYGATKLLQEKLVCRENQRSGNTKLSCVRLGNLSYSSGSFLPLVKECLANDQPIPITDERMTRYFMSLEESARFTLKTLGIMQGGEIFVPKLELVRLMDLVKQVVGKSPKIKIIGKRPGEKLHEILYSENEDIEDCGDYWVIRNSTC